MPKHLVKAAFHYAAGGTVTRYAKGEQELPQAVAEHAIAKGFVDKPKPTAKPTTEPATAPAVAKSK